MIAKWVLSLMGLSAPAIRPDHDVVRAIRHSAAAAWQHDLITSRLQTRALDIIDDHQADGRADEMLKESEQTRQMMERMLGRMK